MFKISDLVSYSNNKTANPILCWVVNVIEKSDGSFKYDLKTLENGYNIMSVPEKFIHIAKIEDK